MDMGEALNVNAELKTVGISNGAWFVRRNKYTVQCVSIALDSPILRTHKMNVVASGCLVGFTGSYIFSQTIFTYRTGTNSRWVGFLVALSFLGVVLSTINVLQVTPLFFLGSTLIFIGVDLLYEWVSIF